MYHGLKLKSKKQGLKIPHPVQKITFETYSDDEPSLWDIEYDLVTGQIVSHSQRAN